MKNKELMPCPYCKSILEIDVDWAIRNERYFCGECCKSFPIRIGEVPEEPKKESIKEKFDKGVEEILKDEDEEQEPNFYWDDF